jgi:hypothetical protein
VCSGGRIAPTNAMQSLSCEVSAALTELARPLIDVLSRTVSNPRPEASSIALFVR